MPNRYVRDSILDSERYHNLSSDSVRLLFHELLLSADDFGLVPVGTLFLRRRAASAASKSNEAIVKMVSELADCDMLRTYDSGAQRYAWVPRNGFTVRSHKPKQPLPDDSPAFKEVNELAKKCSAYAKQPSANAKQLHDRRHTNAADLDFDLDNDFDSGATAPAQQKRGTRLPAAWTPDDGFVQAARGIHPEWPDESIRAVASKFHDYWIGVSGARGVKRDWLATWRNWVRNETKAPAASARQVERSDEI